MGFLPEVQLTDSFWPFAFFRENFGFVPNLFRAQTLIPPVIEAEAGIAQAVLVEESTLSQSLKESIVLVVAAGKKNTYCVTAHYERLLSEGITERQLKQLMVNHHRAGLAEPDVALLDFALKLSQRPTWICREDIDLLRQHGFRDEQILEAVLVTALTHFLSTLSDGLHPTPDFPPRNIPRQAAKLSWGRKLLDLQAHEKAGPYLKAVEMDPDSFAPFTFLQKKFGFIPNLFRAQTLWPGAIEAEAKALETLLLTGDILSRMQKEYICLAVSAVNLNTYCVAAHSELLRGLGLPEDVSDQIALDHRQADLSEADKALLDFALKLSLEPHEFGQGDIDSLRRHRFSDEQILQAIVIVALSNFLNTLQMGLGALPNTEPRRVFGIQEEPSPQRPEPYLRGPEAEVNLFSQAENLMYEDLDLGLLDRIQKGDMAAFAELVRRHERHVYRTLIAIIGNPADAEDGTQNVFLKAYRNLGRFQRTSKFSTWLTRIAINEAVQQLRKQKREKGLEERDAAEDFKPRQVVAWEDDPETLHSKKELRELVERELMRLPAKYRTAIVLKDMEQLPTREAAAVLGLEIPAFKSRLLRGRLMLREALAPHFTEARRRIRGV